MIHNCKTFKNFKTFKSIKEFEETKKMKNIQLCRQKYLLVENTLRLDPNNHILNFDGNVKNNENFKIYNDKLYARINENNDTHLYLLMYTENTNGGKRHRNRKQKSNKTKRRRHEVKSRNKKTKKRQKK